MKNQYGRMYGRVVVAFSILMIFAGFGSAFAITSDGATDICNSPTVHTLSQSQKSYVVKYQILEGTRQDLPTLVYLQGGPGGTAILPDSTPHHAWTELRMDMPGTGCSAIDASVDRDQLDLSTDHFVELWAQLIRELKIKNVSLQGRSYGTQIATQLAARIEADSSTKLQAVILEGTTGPAGHAPQWATGYLDGWTALRKQYSSLLSPEKVETDRPYGVEPDEWTTFSIYALTWNMFPVSGMYTHSIFQLKALADANSSPSEKAAVFDVIHQVNLKMHALIDSYLYQRLSCEESNPSGMEYNLKWDHGQLALPAHGFCEGKPWKLSRPYDAKKFSYHAPTIYIEGGEDPNTPLGGKLYHVSVSLNSPRTLVLTKIGGHGILESGVFLDCKDSILTDVLENSAITPNTFSKCSYRDFQIYRFEPGENLQKYSQLPGELKHYLDGLQKITP